MAFNLNGSVIEQTGTDTNLSALAGVGGVTATTYGDIREYRVPASRQFDIQGTLTINPYTETLLITDNVAGENAASPMLITGTLNVGTQAVNGVFPSSIPAIVFGGTPNPWWSGANPSGNTTGSTLVVAVGANLNWNGGAMIGNISVSFQGSTNIDNNATFIVNEGGQTGTVAFLARFFNDNLTIGALEYQGGSISLGSGIEGSRLSINRANSGVAFWPQYVGGGDVSRRNPVTIFDSSTIGNTVDYVTFQQVVLNVENPLQGTSVAIRGAQGSTHANNSGHIIVYRTLATDITNLAGNNVQGYFRLEDYDNNERKDLDVAGDNINDDVQFVYDFPINGSLGTNNVVHPATSSHQFCPNNAIISAIVSVEGANPDGTSNVGPYIKDLRGYTTLEADGLTVDTSVEGQQNIRGYLWSYNEQTQVIDINLDDDTTGDITVSRIITPDAAITNATSTFTAGDIAIDATNGNITTAVALTTNDLYDYVKHLKVNDITLRRTPSLDTMSLELYNTTSINAGTRNITLGGSLTGSAEKPSVTAGLLAVGGNDLSNIAFNGVTSGNFGALTNGTSITTTDTAARTVASMDTGTLITAGEIDVTGAFSNGSVLTSTTHVEVDGAASESTITSTGGRVQLDGGSTDVMASSVGFMDINPGTHLRLDARTGPTGAADVRAQGSTLDDCTINSRNHILLNNAEVDGGYFRTRYADPILPVAFGNIDMTGATVNNARLVARNYILGDTVTNILQDGNIYGDRSITGLAQIFEIDYQITTATTVTMADILGTNYTVDMDFTAGDTFRITNGIAGVTLTIEVTADDVTAFRIRNQADTGPLGQGETFVDGNVTYSFVAPGTTTTFTNEPSADGGNLAVFNRATPTATWTLVERQTLAANAVADIEVVDALGEYLTLWKPLNSSTYTSSRHINYAIIPPADNEERTDTLSVLSILESGMPVPATVTPYNWTAPTVGVFAGQLLLTFGGTSASSGNNRLEGGTTQSVLMALLATQLYFDYIITNAATVIPVDATMVEDELRFVEARDSSSSNANGDYIELTTSDGQQQRLTAITNTGSGGTALAGRISAVIMGTLAGTTTVVEFDAVDIAANPLGITTEQVTAAVRVLTNELSTEHARLSQNQQANQVAIQRGAVKAATYSADDIDIIT